MAASPVVEFSVGVLDAHALLGIEEIIRNHDAVRVFAYLRQSYFPVLCPVVYVGLLGHVKETEVVTYSDGGTLWLQFLLAFDGIDEHVLLGAEHFVYLHVVVYVTAVDVAHIQLVVGSAGYDGVGYQVSLSYGLDYYVVHVVVAQLCVFEAVGIGME